MSETSYLITIEQMKKIKTIIVSIEAKVECCCGVCGVMLSCGELCEVLASLKEIQKIQARIHTQDLPGQFFNITGHGITEGDAE